MKRIEIYWRAIRRWWLFRWLFFTIIDVLSCLLFVIYKIFYAKPACPFATVDVPPNDINHAIEWTRFVRSRLYWFSGLIKTKDWEHVTPLRREHRTLADRFSEIFAAANSQMPHQRQSDLVRYRSIFEALFTRGFAVHTWRNRTTDPFYLSIGANGEFLFQTGKHRLALAKVAGVNAIPARISARHRKWQAYRDEIYRKGKDGEISMDQLDAIEHPDLQDIVLAVKRVRTQK